MPGVADRLRSRGALSEGGLSLLARKLVSHSCALHQAKLGTRVRCSTTSRADLLHVARHSAYDLNVTLTGIEC